MTFDASANPSASRSMQAIFFLLSITAVLLELIPSIAGGYGYFIDEWYYIACAHRPALGYVDQPPLAALLLGAVMWIAGHSIVAIRFLPALAAGGTVYLTGRMARELGGGTFAQGLACVSTLLAPGVLIICGFFSMNAFELLLWSLCSLLFLLVLKDDDPRRWILIGIVFGVGLENKHTMLLLGIAFAFGMLMTPYRRHFASKQLWVGLALAAIIFLPNIVWQILNGWPSLEFYAAATIYKNVPTPPLKGLMNQILLLNPFAFPVWCVGLLCLLLAKTWKQYRAIGWAYLFLLVLMLASQSSRPDRIAGIYPVLFAAGGAAIESFIASHRVPWLKGVSMAMVVAGGLILLPLSVPILPPESLARYGATLGLIPQLERGKTSQLPQWFADRFDWDSFVTTVSDIYHRLPGEDRKRAVIFVPSYGHAGALEVYGPALGLPRVICNHNSYYLWSAGHANAEVLLAIGPSQHDLKKIYAQVDSVGIITVTYGMSWRNNMRVYLARKPTTPFNDVWEKTKHYE